VRIIYCSVGVYPRLEAVYVVRDGKLPLPSSIGRARLPLLLQALELDGWLTRREAEEALRLVSELHSLRGARVNLEVLAAALGQPFEELLGYAYLPEETVKRIAERGGLAAFWIAPGFHLSSVVLALAARGDKPLVVGSANLLSDEQLRFLLSILRSGDWLHSESLDRRLLAVASRLLVGTRVNLGGALRALGLTAEMLEMAGRVVEVEVVKGLPKASKLLNFIVARRLGAAARLHDPEVLEGFGGYPLYRRPRLNRFKLALGELEEAWKALDELAMGGSMPYTSFAELLREAVGDGWLEALSLMLALGLVELRGSQVAVTAKGLAWLVEERG